MKNNIFNIPATCAFLDVLAKRFLTQYESDELGLSSMLILVPNRRSAQNLKEAFVRQQGLKPTILPQIEAVGDLQEDELFLSDISQEDLQKLLPAVDPLERQLLFTKIIRSKPENFGSGHFSYVQASILAKELSRLVDSVYEEELDFSKLNELVPEEYAAHWQETLKFLTIITAYWPEILAEKNKTDASFRHNTLLRLKSRQWLTEMPERHIVAAGIYADYPAIKELLKTILLLPNGEIYINGLDRNLDEDEWTGIEETHPQYQLARLLDFLQLKREDVADIIKSENKERERFVSEIMRPAEFTDKWLMLKEKGIMRDALSGISFISCKTLHEEAVSAALIIREKLEEKESTVALVTPDRNLSRMVASEVERWGIIADDSAGKPLHLQPIAIYLRQIYDVVQNKFGDEELLSLLKNPFCLCEKPISEFRKEVRDFEKEFLRANKKEEEGTKEKYIEWKENIRQYLLPLSELFERKTVDLRELIVSHLSCAERMASSDIKSGAQLLWKGESGASAAEFFAELLEKADILGKIDTAEYLEFIEHLMSFKTVRRQYGTHPRLKILGPVEARLLDFDYVIIAEVNEGVWPPVVAADPWMSRLMKKDFGLPLPEKNIGIFANDFANLLCKRNVYLLRAKRADGVPTNASRWGLRLGTVASAVFEKTDFLYNSQYSDWAGLLDCPDKSIRYGAPAPRPDTTLRPHKLSVSGLKDLIDNPYKAYVKYILKIFPLEGLDREADARLYGVCVHKALEMFLTQYQFDIPANSKELLLDLGKKLFDEKGVEKTKQIFWLAKYEKMINWFLQEENNIKEGLVKILMEKEGEYRFSLPSGDFVLTAIADRINIYNDGILKIIDYKTGNYAPSKASVEAYKEPQLIVEGVIAINGGFKDVEAEEISRLSYWQLGKSKVEFEGKKVEELIKYGFEKFKDILEYYDSSESAYTVKTKPKYVTGTDDYEHLSRIKEWGTQGDDDEE